MFHAMSLSRSKDTCIITYLQIKDQQPLHLRGQVGEFSDELGWKVKHL